MQPLTLTAAQLSLVDEIVTSTENDDLLSMPLTEAKRLAAADFECRYLTRLMARVGGSVSAGARIAGLDRTNFRRLLQRHGLR